MKRGARNRSTDTTADAEAIADAPGEKHHRGSALLAVGAVLGLAGLVMVGYGWLALQNNWFPFHSAPPREVSLDEARERFLGDQAEDSGGARPFVPAAGVYQYRGGGSEELSNPQRTQAEGPEIPGTVTHRDGGCWSFRLDYSTNHWRRWSFCSTGDALVQEGTRVFQRWDFGSFAVDNLSTVTCRPPAVVMERDMEVGDEWASECRGENTSIEGTTISTGTHRLVAVETLSIGGTPVEAFHFRDERTVSGAQSGAEQFEFWLSGDGLVLKGQQRIVVESDSPLGRVTYTQQSAFELVQTTPSG